ncbi:hypothetical protein K470DRAFT_267295 [Piedraia hortae CBS 480.64]|uniref:Uncharacterized protein n=1 Tax=Piedraia hortae CBS 480.64 TaxID=1314780 RepID=A0A6A7CAI4_9PEZI|nr:hypothetical protein K470DRAFT_267295 [Piedraia hortae CBS 480.64]
MGELADLEDMIGVLADPDDVSVEVNPEVPVAELYGDGLGDALPEPEPELVKDAALPVDAEYEDDECGTPVSVPDLDDVPAVPLETPGEDELADDPVNTEETVLRLNEELAGTPVLVLRLEVPTDADPDEVPAERDDEAEAVPLLVPYWLPLDDKLAGTPLLMLRLEVLVDAGPDEVPTGREDDSEAVSLLTDWLPLDEPDRSEAVELKLEDFEKTVSLLGPRLPLVVPTIGVELVLDDGADADVVAELKPLLLGALEVGVNKEVELNPDEPLNAEPVETLDPKLPVLELLDVPGEEVLELSDPEAELLLDVPAEYEETEPGLKDDTDAELLLDEAELNEPDVEPLLDVPSVYDELGPYEEVEAEPVLESDTLLLTLDVAGEYDDAELGLEEDAEALLERKLLDVSEG